MNWKNGLRLAALGGAAFVGWRALRKRDELDLRGRVVLITGGSRGLGLLLAREFADHGARVAICARDQRQLDAARLDLERRGADVLAVPCDVGIRERIEHVVEEVTGRWGRIDILVNNASIIQVGPVETMTIEDFEAAMAVNFWGSVYASMAVLPQMRYRGDGRIVNITSIGSRVAIPHLLPYDCAKFAIRGFSEGLRAEVAADGVTVTTIVPGLMRTGSPVNAFFKGKRDLEFTWFSIGDATPLTAMSAERAARRIVRATRRGEAEVTLTWQAKVLGLVHDLLPGTTAGLLAAVDRALPDPDGGDPAAVRGMKLSTVFSPSPITALMNRAARAYNQFSGAPYPSDAHARRIGLSTRRPSRPRADPHPPPGTPSRG